jgi:predicted nucleic acid-binding protein
VIFLLDTNAFSDLMREHPKMNARLANISPTERVVICSMVRGEIRYGIERLPQGKRRQALEVKAAKLFAVIPCEPVTAAVGDHYATTKLSRQQKGLALDENDLWIAATALALGAVLAALRPADFASLCQATGVPQEQTQGGLGYAYDIGDRLVYALNLNALIGADHSFPILPLIQAIESIWIDAAGEPEAQALSLIEAADHFVRQAGLKEAERRTITICVRQDTSEPVIEHIFATRFGSINRIRSAIDFLCDSVPAKVEGLGQIGRNPFMPTHVRNLKSRKLEVPENAAKALGKIGNAAVPALIDALNDESKKVRSNAARALREIGDKAAVPALKVADSKHYHWSDCEFCDALRKLGDK